MTAETIANGVVLLVGLYVVAGVVFAAWFTTKGVGRIDPVAKEGTRGFRILIIPGVVALWPLLAKRVAGGVTTPPTETNAHRRAAMGDSPS